MENIIITKELLSSVLGIDVMEIDRTTIDSNTLHYIDLKGGTNIHELLYLMEEWAFEKGYIIQPYKTANKKYYCEVFGKGNYWIDFEDDSKIKVLTKACQWIYDRVSLKEKH